MVLKGVDFMLRFDAQNFIYSVNFEIKRKDKSIILKN